MKVMEFKYSVIEKHPLRDCWMVFVPKLPFIPPYFGTKKECEEARVSAEEKAKELLNAS